MTNTNQEFTDFEYVDTANVTSKPKRQSKMAKYSNLDVDIDPLITNKILTKEVNLIDEYKLIQKKESRLSRRQREEVIRLYTLFYVK